MNVGPRATIIVDINATMAITQIKSRSTLSAHTHCDLDKGRGACGYPHTPLGTLG